jgi:hypothetical protein
MPGLAIWKEELDAAGAAPDPRNPVVMQSKRMDTPKKLTALLADAGFSGVKTWTAVGEYRWTIDAIVSTQLGCGLTARRIGSLSPAEAAACETRVRRRLANLEEDAFVYRPEVLLATARA